MIQNYIIVIVLAALGLSIGGGLHFYKQATQLQTGLNQAQESLGPQTQELEKTKALLSQKQRELSVKEAALGTLQSKFDWMKKTYVNIPQYATVKITDRKGSHGSGAFISDDGYILTAAHVARLDKNFNIDTPDHRHFTAYVVTIHPKADIAILKINSVANTILPTLTLSNTPLKQGEKTTLWGYAGNDPLRPKTLVYQESWLGGENDLVFGKGINHGDSGGPIVNSANQIIGIGVAQEVIGKSQKPGRSLGVGIKSIPKF